VFPVKGVIHIEILLVSRAFDKTDRVRNTPCNKNIGDSKDSEFARKQAVINKASRQE
jgi:hypothetical protein